MILSRNSSETLGRERTVTFLQTLEGPLKLTGEFNVANHNESICFLAFLLGTMHALGDAIGILQFHPSVPASIADANSDVTRILL